MTKHETYPNHPGPVDIVTFWSIGLVESLIPIRRRIELDAQMRALFIQNPAWARIWVAGTISNLIRTLPENDVWRHLSARITIPGGDDMVQGELPRPPKLTGAINRAGEPFGTMTDGYDLAQPLFTRIGQDAALAALEDPLTPAAAALLAFCSQGWETGLAAITALCESTNADPQFLFDTGSTALAWAVHRRRTYIGADDLWPVETCFTWTVTAELIAAGETSNVDEVELSISQERIDGSDLGQ